MGGSYIISHVLNSDRLAPHAVRLGASRHPEAIALQHTDGAALTYRELDDDARRWADGFGDHGIGNATHVASLLENRFDAHRTMLGLGWLGAVEIPLNTAFHGRTLGDALARTEATHIVTESAFLPMITDVVGDLTHLRWILVVDDPADAPLDDTLPDGHEVVAFRDTLPERPRAVERAGPVATDTACIIFTSGTTGPSKPVICPWGLVYQMWSWIPDDALGPGDAVFNALPLFHNSGRSGFNYAMSVGARFVLRDKFSATEFWDDVRRHDCRVAALVGPLTSLIASAPPAPTDADNPLESVILGPMIPAMEAFERRFGVRVATCYGQTEIGAPVVTGWDHGPWDNTGSRRHDYPQHDVRLVDDGGVDVGEGVVGEMIVRSDEPGALTPGYYGMPEATVRAWRDGWFHTGDSFRRDDQDRFYFVDRTSDTIRRRGENISSFEVESFVTEHPHVLECAAIAVPAEHGDDEVMAVVTIDDPSFDNAELVRFLASRMPKFMVPRYVEVVDDFPRNETTGRIRKNELRQRGRTDATWDREA